MTVDQMGATLLNMDKINSAATRQAYCALLWVPGYEHLRFNPLLKMAKQKWNHSPVKYGTFWEAENVLAQLMKQNLNWTSVRCVRDRLILVLRIFHLTRSIDLERMVRSISKVGDKFFILLKREGATSGRLGGVIETPL